MSYSDEIRRVKALVYEYRVINTLEARCRAEMIEAIIGYTHAGHSGDERAQSIYGSILSALRRILNLPTFKPDYQKIYEDEA